MHDEDAGEIGVKKIENPLMILSDEDEWLNVLPHTLPEPSCSPALRGRRLGDEGASGVMKPDNLNVP